MTESNDYEYSIDSVANAAKTLLMLRTRSRIRAIDVATELGTARSTAHRMVSTLAQSGLLERNSDDKSYSAGPALIELGLAVTGSGDVLSEVAPVLERIASATGETTHFLVRDGQFMEFLAAAEGTHLIRAAPRVGARQPIHVTSAGKCLLAEYGDDELTAMFPEELAAEFGTDAAIRSRDVLLAEVAEAREKGWALNRAESEEGLFAASTAVHDADGRAIGAFTVSGPYERLEPRVDEIVATLLRERESFEADRRRRSRPRAAG